MTNSSSQININFTIPIHLNADQWIRALEQLLLLLLILGRWFLPKGQLTHDQLSQLLLVYIGTAADIVEFFEAFKENGVRFGHVVFVIFSNLPVVIFLSNPPVGLMITLSNPTVIIILSNLLVV